MSTNTISQTTPIQPADLLDDVVEDPTLSPEEKETTIWWYSDSDIAVMFTSERGTMRRLLQHPEAVILNTNRRSGKVHGIRGTIPVGTISIPTTPRKAGTRADVITRTVLNHSSGAKWGTYTPPSGGKQRTPKETHLYWNKTLNTVSISTDESALCRRLSAHPQVSGGSFSINCLVISKDQRKTAGHANVVPYTALSDSPD